MQDDRLHNGDKSLRNDRIAKQFSQAASTYQKHDCLQRQSAQKLQAGMRVRGVMLDVGAGPGTEFSSVEIEQVIALDIATGMLKQLRYQFPDYLPVCADAQALPLVDNSINTLYSNLALQWCENFTAVVHEFERVLTVGGECHLAIVVENSLQQLSTLGLRVNQFESAQRLLGCFNSSRWALEHQLQTLTVHFDNLKSLLYSIKGVGASVNDQVLGFSSHLRGRQDWLKLMEKAELLRESQGLPLSYEILFIHGKLKG